MGEQGDGNVPPEGAEKGKGKQVAAPEDRDDKPPAGQTGEPSLLTRVGQSAAGLSRSLVGGQHAAAEGLAGLSGAAGKAGPASTSKAASAGEGSAAYRPPRAGAPAAFRSAEAEAHAAAAESAFSDFLDRTSVFVPTEPAGVGSTWQDRPAGPAGPGLPAAPAAPAPAAQVLSSADQQRLRDGQDVVDLLADPDDAVLDFDADVTISEADLPGLRAALFGRDATDPRSATGWDSMLNFVPDFLRAPSGGGGLGLAPPREAASMALGVADPAEAGRQWLEQWRRVLTSYADDVWGDLDGLVAEAREEVRQLEAAAPGAPPPETTALQRLRQVLAHLRR